MTSGFQHDFRMAQRALSKHSMSTQRALREYLKSNLREIEQSDFVIVSEPKILRLVYLLHKGTYPDHFPSVQSLVLFPTITCPSSHVYLAILSEIWLTLPCFGHPDVPQSS